MAKAEAQNNYQAVRLQKIRKQIYLVKGWMIANPDLKTPREFLNIFREMEMNLLREIERKEFNARNQ